MTKIYVRYGRKRSIREFLETFFELNYYGLVSSETFQDSKCTRSQCRAGRQRSFDDLLLLVKTYYVSATPKKLMHELMMFQKVDRLDRIHKMYFKSCPTIMRINLYPSVTRTSYEGVVGRPKRGSEFSWAELLQMIGVVNASGYNNYRDEYLARQKSKKQSITKHAKR